MPVNCMKGGGMNECIRSRHLIPEGLKHADCYTQRQLISESTLQLARTELLLQAQLLGACKRAARVMPIHFLVANANHHLLHRGAGIDSSFAHSAHGTDWAPANHVPSDSLQASPTGLNGAGGEAP
eukprot:2517152-Pleurochrysis_carterae.AAC.1